MSGRLETVWHYQVGLSSPPSADSTDTPAPVIETYDWRGHKQYSLNRENTTVREFDPELKRAFDHVEVVDKLGDIHKLVSRNGLIAELQEERFRADYASEVDPTTHWYYQRLGEVALETFVSQVATSFCSTDLLPEELAMPRPIDDHQLQLFKLKARQQLPAEVAEFEPAERLVEDRLHGRRTQPILLGLDHQGVVHHNLNWSNTKIRLFSNAPVDLTHLEVKPCPGTSYRLPTDVDTTELFFQHGFPSTTQPEAEQEVHDWFQQQLGATACRSLPLVSTNARQN